MLCNIKLQTVSLFIYIFFLQYTICVAQYGDLIPEYTFTEILNDESRIFTTRQNNKPYIIEFSATWCSPCIPAMRKLEKLQEKYGEHIDIIAVSSDKRNYLERYISNTKTVLPIIYDSLHHNVFTYRYIPHTILVDKNGIVQAKTTPEYLKDRVIENLINGKPLLIQEKSEENDDFRIIKKEQNLDYSYQFTTHNPELRFSNDIVRNDEGVISSVNFKNVSIYRLLADLYQLSSAAKLYFPQEPPKERYCLTIDKNPSSSLDVLSLAKQIVKKELKQDHIFDLIHLETSYVLEVIDESFLPPKTGTDITTLSFMGPTYSGKNITSFNLIEYLESQLTSPVVDKVQLDYSFDMDLEWSYENPTTLNDELKKYGMKVRPVHATEQVKVLVISFLE